MLFGDDDNIASTISQPSFVLRMLDLLQIQPGQTVLELGTGSGWNAALIGQLVGPSGRVRSLEIIPEVAQRAAEAIADLGITNVRVIVADGGDGYAAGAPYDRVAFTAGTLRRSDLQGADAKKPRPNGRLASLANTAQELGLAYHTTER